MIKRAEKGEIIRIRRHKTVTSVVLMTFPLGLVIRPQSEEIPHEPLFIETKKAQLEELLAKIEAELKTNVLTQGGRVNILGVRTGLLIALGRVDPAEILSELIEDPFADS